MPLVQGEPMVFCSCCGWEGNENELVEKEGAFILYDHVLSNAYSLEMKRMNYHCPKCDSIIKTKRKSEIEALENI